MKKKKNRVGRFLLFLFQYATIKNTCMKSMCIDCWFSVYDFLFWELISSWMFKQTEKNPDIKLQQFNK